MRRAAAHLTLQPPVAPAVRFTVAGAAAPQVPAVQMPARK